MHAALRGALRSLTGSSALKPAFAIESCVCPCAHARSLTRTLTHGLARTCLRSGSDALCTHNRPPVYGRRASRVRAHLHAAMHECSRTRAETRLGNGGDSDRDSDEGRDERRVRAARTRWRVAGRVRVCVYLMLVCALS
eukprot:6201509-Pleurochrysis_carterae.AAC.1